MKGTPICGIVVDHHFPDEAAGPRMLSRIRHRGPDDTDALRANSSFLGHNRLSIVDVAGGRQPINDGDWHMVGNGEVYNHAELRRELGEHRFHTDSDNEVALHAVQVWGPESIARLKGMFAFAVMDPDGGLTVARDPLGIKPLYWARRDGRIVFASELRAFDTDLRPHVEVFPPGSWWRTGLEEPVHFEDIGAPVGSFDTREEALEGVRESLITAISRRMMADVGVGVFLSGGLDSSIVAAVAAHAARQQGQVVKTFAVGTEGSSDLIAARRVADHIGTDHYEHVYTAEEAVASVDKVVEAMESYEPSLVRSAVPNYLVAELAARHVKVVLTGEGADELFAGYDYYRRYTDHDELDAELLRSVRGLHNLNLQRCDRVTMAHGLEARVPFLDLDMIATARRVPPAWKLPGERGQEKRLLREAFDGWLPHDLLWRGKEQFGDGSGAAEAITEHMAARAEEQFSNGNGHLEGLPEPRTAEELAYQQAFYAVLAGIPTDSVLGRFATA